MGKAWAVAVAAAILATPQASAPWAASFEGAEAQLLSGDLAGAVQRFDALWKAHPGDPLLAVSIGSVLDASAHHTEATGWYQKALATRPGYEPALNDLALNYAVRGELAQAANMLRQLIHARPGDARALYNLGLIDLRLGNYQEAAAALRRARAAVEPPAPPQQIALAEATALFHLAKYTATAALLTDKSAARDASTLLLRGSAQALAGDLPAAVDTFQQAARVFPDNVQLYYRLALVFMQGHRDGDAQDVLDAGLRQLPDAPLLLYANGVLKYVSGQYGEAIVWARRSLEANPKQPEVAAFLGRVYAETGQTNNALKAYGEALRIGGPSVDVGVSAAELLLKIGELHQAETQLNTLARAYPDSALVDRGLGSLYRAEEKYDLAERFLRRSIRRNARDARTHFVLAEVLRLTGRPDEAQKELAIFNEQKKAEATVRLLEVAPSSPSRQ